MKLVDDNSPESRSFWKTDGETERGRAIIREARRLSLLDAYKMLSDSEILRIAFMNTNGDRK